VEGVADQDAFLPRAAVADDLHVHLGDQRTGGVEHLQSERVGFRLYGLRHTMRAEHDDRHGLARLRRRHVFQLVDEDGAALPEILDDKLVVHDFMAHVDRRAEGVGSRCRLRDRHPRRNRADWRG
jgi:hypothetical protein